jgi:peptidoglycan/LPS O-acetylase OafA/YrhL
MIFPARDAVEDRDRFGVLDAWRGIAALMVALYRLEAEGWLHGLSLVRNAWLFVDFFFVLSGFVIAHAYAERLGTGISTMVFLIRRFGRVWPLHAALLFAFVFSELTRSIAGSVRSGSSSAFIGTRAPITVLWDGLLVQALGMTGPTGWNTPAWSISTEFWTYIVFALLCFGGRKLVLWAAPVLVLGGIGVVGLYSTQGMDTTFDFGFARCLAGFFSGVLVHALWQRTKDAGNTWFSKVWSSKAWVNRAGVVELLVVGVAFAFVALAGRSTLSLFAPLVFAVMVYVFAFEQGPVSRMLCGAAGQLVGRLSYSIYMTALLISLVFNKGIIALYAKAGHSIAREATVNGHVQTVYDIGLPLTNDAYALVYLASVTGVSWLTYRLIEDPARKMFNGWSTRFA